MANKTLSLSEWFLCVAVLCGGCATRAPLVSLPEVHSTALCVETRGEPGVETESAAGRNARRNEGQGGLLGIVIGESVAASTKGGSGAVLQQLREQTHEPEQALLEQAVRNQIQAAGLSCTEPPAPRTLMLQLEAIRLEELQRGFWQVNAQVTAVLRDAAHKSLWTVHICASSPKLRSLQDFSQQPQLYVQDFREAAQDAAHQLVVGPIRH